MNIISFMSANYVARQTNYHMTGGWGEGDRSTNEYFRPIDTFSERFNQLLADIRALGFNALDLWTAQLNPSWATDGHIEIACSLLQKHNLRMVSLAGWFGSTVEELEKTCKIAVAMGAEILGGSTSALEKDRAVTIALLQKYDLRLGLENHPEKTPQEMLDKIGDGGGGRIGTALDTGWYGTQGYGAAQAIVELRDHLFHVHLKDVREVGAHNTCRYGEGIVPIETCVRALNEIGYTGAISIEHEPELFDPTDDCRENLALLRTWLSNASKEVQW